MKKKSTAEEMEELAKSTSKMKSEELTPEKIKSIIEEQYEERARRAGLLK